MREELSAIKTTALAEIEKITELEKLEEWRIRYLGRKSRLSQLLSQIKELPPQQRPQIGAIANEVKKTLEERLKQKQQILQQLEWQKREKPIDISLPGRHLFQGGLHPITQAIREISAVFQRMGFEVVEGPEVEWDYYNFEALNLPQGHPAREMFSTFWIDWGGQGKKAMLLRTHTSPMQIRIMESRKPPIRVIVPGKVFRYEATDATHESMFHQIEGLAVDKNITMGDLKGTLYEFARILFGENCRVRFRCTYFPFVEPGVDMAIDCFLCGGRGCRVCSYSGWLEILGAGMVHPEVFLRVNYDSQVYSGFAFGLGVERIWMLKYGINDIRLFYQNDLRFLSQL